MTQPGLYLINGSGEMTALHTAGPDSGDDEKLLQEYLEEWDLCGRSKPDPKDELLSVAIPGSSTRMKPGVDVEEFDD